jgi:hypothetical protein
LIKEIDKKNYEEGEKVEYIPVWEDVDMKIA